ncbi:hypothetical protein ILYODFUR_035467 [Ilyodon furcidens]|uniref:Uncharacterized protein n=1 Tax=Ilyodon furcidens TaxID=33524 RepID=A0ABV0TRB2_9TELE
MAMVATEARSHLGALYLRWAVLLVLQLGLQNYFIIAGLNWEPFHLIQMAAMHTNACTVQDHTEIQIVVDRNESKSVRTLGSDETKWRRRALKEVCAFLLLSQVKFIYLSNIIVRYISAFSLVFCSTFVYYLSVYFHSSGSCQLSGLVLCLITL